MPDYNLGHDEKDNFMKDVSDSHLHKSESGTILVIAERAFHELYRSFSTKGVRMEIRTHKESLESIQRLPVDIVIMDSGLDVSGALRLLREIKTLQPGIPVIFLTDNQSVNAVKEAYRAGARVFIEKPVNFFELRGDLENLLKIKKTSREKRSPFITSRDPEAAGAAKTLTTGKPAYIIRAVRYIEDNLSEKISLDRLAKEANLSKFHFCRVFFRHIGMTPLQFTAFMRVEKAKELLAREDLNVSIVAVQVGFNDLGTFLRQFKKLTGVTPTVFKSTIKKLEISPGHLSGPVF